MNLELQGITKRFGSLVANDHIDLSIVPGTIHALLGENGAGKTTLMNILYGLTQPDEGTILADGKPLTIHSPKDAIAAGIGMVHQHFMLVPVFTVAENVTLGDEETRALGLLDRRRMRRKVRDLSQRYGLRVDPDALTGDLPVGVQQRVEILKALVRDAQVLILDEPTAVLTPGETEDLFRIMRELRESGRAIVFISHKLKEVQAIADTVTILRRGRVVGEAPAGHRRGRAGRADGRPLRPAAGQQDDRQARPGRAGRPRPGRPRRSRRAARRGAHRRRQRAVVPRPGGRDPRHRRRAGQRPDRALRGPDGPAARRAPARCTWTITTSPARHRAPGCSAGIGYIPEDRQEDGLVSSFPVSENIVLDTYNRPPFASGLALKLGEIRAVAEQRVSEFDIRTQLIDAPVGTLSGGNQQKVILAREVGREVRLLLASQPTRGLDVGSIEFVHRRIIEERDNGVAVVLVSSELDEIYALADQIAIMYEGRFTGFRPPDVPVEELGLLMAGVGGDGAAERAADAGAARAECRRGRPMLGGRPMLTEAWAADAPDAGPPDAGGPPAADSPERAGLGAAGPAGRTGPGTAAADPAAPGDGDDPTVTVRKPT